MAVIVIDPGHYGAYNPGVCPGYFEGNTMLVLSKYLGAALTGMGADVKYTRTTNEQNPSLSERGGMAAGADLFISLHSDASDNASARGVTSYISVRQPETEPFATAIGEATANAMGNQFRGVIARPSETTPGQDYYGVLRSAVAAGAKNALLLEQGFHTNMQDCAILSDNAALQRMAGAQAKVIAEQFGLTSGSGGASQVFGVQYTIQPGEYLYIIGQKFGIPWQVIAATNGIVSPYVVMPGQRIIIPMPMAR